MNNIFYTLSSFMASCGWRFDYRVYCLSVHLYLLLLLFGRRFLVGGFVNTSKAILIINSLPLLALETAKWICRIVKY